MELMPYHAVERMVCAVTEKIERASGIEVRKDRRSTNGNFHAGLYHDALDYISYGALSLVHGEVSGFVSCVDCLSMCKQHLHEYRHWQQRQMYNGRSYISADPAILALPFDDNGFCRVMARQNLISAEFSMYRIANQYVLSYERDAEEYAVRAVPSMMAAVGFPEELIEPCLVGEINRRIDWYGVQPVATPASAAEDLRAKKHGLSEARLPLDYEPVHPLEVSKTFCHDEKAQAEYMAAISGSGGFADGDRFLLDYIARHDPKVFGLYDIIRDEMPKLSAFEKLQRQLYRTSHGLPDVNDYDVPEL